GLVPFFGGSLVAVEQTDVVKCTHLVVLNPVVVVISVDLECSEGEDEISGAAMAGHALGTTWKTPELGAVDRSHLRLRAVGRDEVCVGLSFIPAVRVAKPLALL